MKYVLLLTILIYSTSAFSQTISQSDLPFAGLVWTSGVDTNFADPVLPGGAAQTWDYSNLVTGFIDTSGFQDAAGTLYAGTFPSANLAAHKAGTNEWTYFSSTSSGFYVNGFASDSLILSFTPPQMYVPVPFSYGDMQTNISRVVIDTTYLTFNAQVILNFNAQFFSDGYGTLITPVSTYPSTLRIKETLLETDSLMIDYTGTGNYTLLGSQQRQLTNFRWFQHGGTANYILGIEADSLGNFATQSDYVLQWAVLGTNEINVKNKLNIYPNPADKQLIISGESFALASIDIYNLLGEKVLTKQPGMNPDFSRTQMTEMKLDIADWTTGIYFYHAISGEKYFSGSFSIVH